LGDEREYSDRRTWIVDIRKLKVLLDSGHPYEEETMLRRLASAAFIVIASVQSPPLPSQSVWTLPTPNSTYTGTATGRTTDVAGANITLSKSAAAESSDSATPATPFGVVSAKVPAEALRGRRVTLRGELQARGSGGASLWMRVDKTDGMLILDNGQDRAVKGDAEWTPFTVSLPVPSAATSIVVGMMLQGAGSVAARAVRIEAGTRLLADMPVAPDAQKVLDAAIDIVKKSAWMRGNIDWAVMQPDLRLMSGGATESSEVYPAISFRLRRQDHSRRQAGR